MRYERVKLAEAAAHFQRLAVIVDAVRRARATICRDLAARTSSISARTIGAGAQPPR